MDNNETYFNGDRVEMTGETRELHGRTWLVGVFTEGTRKGEECILPTPEDKERDIERDRENWERKQDGFSRLRKLTDK